MLSTNLLLNQPTPNYGYFPLVNTNPQWPSLSMQNFSGQSIPIQYILLQPLYLTRISGHLNKSNIMWLKNQSNAVHDTDQKLS